MTVSVADFKAYFNVSHDVDDAVIASNIAAAETYIDGFLESKLANYEADEEDVPAPILEAIKVVAAHLYERREASMPGSDAEKLPAVALDLIGPYRAWSFG